MSAGGKGSSPRPFNVAFEQYAANFDQIFRKSNVLHTQTQKPNGTPEADSQPQGGCNSSGDSQIPADNKPAL